MSGGPRAPATSVETGQAQADPNQFELFQQLIETERQRSRALDRRTDVALEAVKAGDAADKRQYEFHIRRLESDERLAQSQHSLLSRVVMWGGSLVSIFLILILYMAFFGTPIQADRAEKILTWVFTALGGGGLLLLCQHIIRLLRR